MNVNKILSQADSTDEAARWILICGAEGKYTLADAENGEPVGFTCSDGIENVTVTEMYNIVPINGIFCGEEETLGYKFQLYQGGQWGFISKGYLQFIYPIFEDIVVVNSNEGLCLFAYANAGNGLINISISREFHCVNMHSEHRLVDIEYMYGEEPNSNCFRNVSKEDFLPQADAKVVRDSYDCGHVTFYKPSGDAVVALMNGVLEGSFGTIILKLKDKILYAYRNHSSKWRIPAWEVSIDTACKILEADKLGYSVETNIENSTIYIVEREGYYAIVSIDLQTLKINHYETPFAFTKIEKGRYRDCFYVEQFGKKGVYKLYSHGSPYLIPCEYESIELNHAENFVVKRMGKVGVISSVHGGWIEHLHPEN